MRRSSGFTLFELLVTVAIVGVLAGALLNRVNFYQEQAELAAVQNIVGVIRSSLNMRAAQLAAMGRNGEIGKLVTVNPMDLLAQKPANYAGEYFSPHNFNISSGNWYFNRQKLLLVYIMRTGSSSRGPDVKQFQYRIELISALDDATGPKPAETSNSIKIEGVTLSAVPDKSQQVTQSIK